MAAKVFAIGSGLQVSGGHHIEGSGPTLISHTGTTKTFTVTVADKTAAHIMYGVGSSSGYFINGVEGPWLTLTHGTYKFDQSDSSNGSHPLRFSETVHGTQNGGSEYTTGVTTSGTPGSADAYTQIVISATTPKLLYFYCSNHGGMGQGLTNIGAVDVSMKAGGAFTGPITGVDINGTELILDEDGDTSITADTDDRIDFKTAGSDRVHIASDGKVGIGTSGPAVALEVIDTGNLETVAGFGADDDGTAFISVRTAETQNNLAGITFEVGSATPTGVSSSTSLGHVVGKVMNSSGALQGELQFHTNDGDSITQKMVITEDGKVGIGRTDPSTLLDVNGETLVRGNLGIIGNSGVISPQDSGSGYMRIQGGGTNHGGAIEFRGGGNSGDLRFLTGTSGAGTERIRITSAGKVGIGKTDPAEMLEIYNTTSPAIQINDGGDYQSIIRLAGNDLEIRGSSGQLEFYTGNADGDSSTLRFYIDASGHFLPNADNSYNLGSSSLRFANFYTHDLNLNNTGSGGNEVDGTEGSWTIQEGEDNLYLINRKTNKKYKFTLEEV